MFLNKLILAIAAVVVSLIVAYRKGIGSDRQSDTAPGSAEMFDSIAGFYDLGNVLISAGMHNSWKRDLLSYMKLAPDSLLLDVSTGTADVAVMAYLEFNVQQIVGIDPSTEMLKVAMSKLESLGISRNVHLVVGVAEDMHNFESSSFDAVTVSFGIRNIPDRSMALKEIHRVLRSNGILGILELAPPDDSSIGIISGCFLKYFVPLIGYILGSCGNEYGYLQESVFRFPPDFEKVIEGAGFDVIAIHNYLGGLIKIYFSRKI